MVTIHRIQSARKFFVMFFIISLSISYFSVFLVYSPASNVEFETNLHTSTTLDTDYSPINTDGIQPVGNMTIEKIESLGHGTMETTAVGIDPQNISFTYIDYDWVDVRQIAYEESHGAEWWTGNIELRMNETVRYDYYANDTATLLSYKPELSRAEIIGMNINKSSIDVEEVTLSGFGGFLYNYSAYHDNNTKGTLNVDYIYDYNVTIKDWRSRQKQFPYSPVESPFIDLYEQTEFTSYYNYTFQVGDFNVNMTVDMIVNLPDVDYLQDVEWSKRFNLSSTIPYEDATQLTNSSFRLPDIRVDTKLYIIEFTTNHTVEIVNEFSDYWRRDYLTDGTKTRIRDFDISVIDGPPSILVSNFRLNLTEFNYEEYIEVTSNFGRPLKTFNLRDIGDRSQNGTRIDFFGETAYLSADYYLLIGEVDTISVKYRAPTSLNIKIVDKINNPLKNAEVKLNFGTSPNATYGTFISEDLSIPYAYKLTDSLGYVYYPDVPRGNYTVDVYYQNRHVASGAIIDTNLTENLVYTSVPHFPAWVILFGSTSALIGAIGYLILKNAKS